MLHEHPDLGIFRQTVRQIGRGAAAFALCHLLGGSAPRRRSGALFFHLALGGGDGAEAGVRGAAISWIGWSGAGKRFSTSTTWALATRALDLGPCHRPIFAPRCP